MGAFKNNIYQVVIWFLWLTPDAAQTCPGLQDFYAALVVSFWFLPSCQDDLGFVSFGLFSLCVLQPVTMEVFVEKPLYAKCLCYTSSYMCLSDRCGNGLQVRPSARSLARLMCRFRLNRLAFSVSGD